MAGTVGDRVPEGASPMSRTSRRPGRVLLAGATLVAAALITAYLAVGRRRHVRWGATERERLETEIAPEVFLLGPWGRTQTNAYLIGAGSSWALVDAGWADDGPRIQAAVRSMVGPDATPSAILLTHAHPDHGGSARELARAWGCPVLVHPAEIPLATGDFEAMGRFAGPLDRWLILPLMRVIGGRRRRAILDGSSLAGIVQPLRPGGTIPGLEGWGWIATPGHTPGHVAYVRGRDGVVLSGDAVVTLDVNAWAGLIRGRQGLSGPPWYTTWDREAAIASIARIADLEPTVLAGGHGLPLAGPGTAAAIRAFAARTTAERRELGSRGMR